MDLRQISEIRDTRYEIRNGSAIILAIVLTTLLAMVGVLFLLSSRVDSVATSAVGGNEDLKLAVDTVVSQISQNLTTDVARGAIDPNQYADYPDPCNPWLACLEPYKFGPDYFWRQVSNIYGYAVQTQIVQAQILPDYNNTFVPYTQADADGDGVSDSIWVQVPGKMSAKGKPIYAAIRIIDNGGMLNINTAYKFDPNDSNHIDGSSQTQINLAELSQRGLNGTLGTAALKLDNWRCGTEPGYLYEPNVIWQYGRPAGAFTPFDISDELVLRNRYILNNDQWASRIENLWTRAFKDGLGVPRDRGTTIRDANWAWVTYNYYPFPCSDPCTYDYHHIATTYNLDRIINPASQKMTNINTASKAEILGTLQAGLSKTIPGDVNELAAQITANLIDYIDTDSNVTVIEVNDPNTGLPKRYYGLETPCIYISEIAESIISFPNDINASSYAIELYKPYWTDPSPSTDPCNSWRLLIDKGITIPPIPIVWSGSQRFHVIESIDMNAPIEVNFSDVNGPNDINEPNKIAQHAYVAFSGGELMELQRYVSEAHTFITVDYVWVPEPNASTGWLQPIDEVNNPSAQKAYSYQRDMGGLGTNPNKLIRGKPVAPGLGLWSLDFGVVMLPSIGGPNPWVAPEPYTSPYLIQAHPANKPFTNIGEIGQLLRTSVYTITRAQLEPDVRLNIADQNFQSIFKYLTVIDPAPYTGDSNETRIKGRININTAPWFVLAQLPWVSYHTQPNYNLARSIVNYRDTIHGPFRNIGELMTDANNSINSIGYYEGRVLPPGLLTPPDGAGDGFEERDVIFDRISNLVTVRSDVFTAYILVRIGTDGPQKRVIAILDRSGVTPAGGKVKIVAIQSVPDPR